MNENIFRVLVGFTNLSAYERELFARELSNYQHCNYIEQLLLKTAYNTKATAGQEHTACKCCGHL